MELLIIILSVVVLVFVLSSEKFRKALSARFRSLQSNAADAIDSANAQMDNALMEAEGGLKTVRSKQLEVLTKKNLAQAELKTAQDQAARYNRAAEAGLRTGDEKTATESAGKALEYEAAVTRLQGTLEQIEKSYEEIERARVELENRKSDLRMQQKEFKSRASAAEATITARELTGSIDANAGKNAAARAEEIVRELEAKAGAVSELSMDADEDFEERVSRLVDGTSEQSVQAKLDSIRARIHGSSNTAVTPQGPEL